MHDKEIYIIITYKKILVCYMYNTHAHTHTENNTFVHVGNKTKWDKYILFVNNHFYNGCSVFIIIDFVGNLGTFFLPE